MNPNIIRIPLILFFIVTGILFSFFDNKKETTFLGDSPIPGDEEPVFFIHELWKGRGGRSIITAHDGTILAFNCRGEDNILRASKDGGRTWGESREIGYDANGSVVLNEITGEILLVDAKQGYMWKSNDNGQTWVREEIEILPDGFGHGTPDGVPLYNGADQSGVTLMHGEHKGRLLMSARILGPVKTNEQRWWPYHYNTAIYSDDGGKIWQVSKPFPVFGTGEAALAEISDGSIIYNSREHMSKGNRFIAWSYDGGDTWLNAYRCDYLPDGTRGDRYGNMGGLIRLPVEGEDILIYSNLDHDGGYFRGRDRQKITVWASFDGGKTWPVKRLVFDGPSAYSNLGVGRAGTASEGKIYLLFEGGHEGQYSAINVAVFNLSWILDGRDIKELLGN